MSQDVIKDKYARLFEIPNHLSEMNIDVTCICLSYQGADQGTLVKDTTISWLSYNFFPTFGIKYLRNLYRAIGKIKPDAIVASSDVLHIIIGSWISRWFGIRFYADLYDNYEAFGMSKFPFLKTLFRKALARADHVFAVSDTLRDYVLNLTNAENTSTVVSTINPDLFYSMDTDQARSNLGIELDTNEIAIGMGGSIDKSRGVEHLFSAFEKVRDSYPSAALYLVGNLEDKKYIDIDGVRYLGRLKHEQMNSFFNAMDINVISMIQNKLGEHAFPQKAYEMAAAKKPCVVPGFGAMGALFKSVPSSLYTPGDSDSICKAITTQIRAPRTPNFEIPGWGDQAQLIHRKVFDL